MFCPECCLTVRKAVIPNSQKSERNGYFAGYLQERVCIHRDAWKNTLTIRKATWYIEASQRLRRDHKFLFCHLMLGKLCECLCGLDCCEALRHAMDRITWRAGQYWATLANRVSGEKLQVRPKAEGMCPLQGQQWWRMIPNPKEQVYVATVQICLENWQQSPDEASLSLQV